MSQLTERIDVFSWSPAVSTMANGCCPRVVGRMMRPRKKQLHERLGKKVNNLELSLCLVKADDPRLAEALTLSFLWLSSHLFAILEKQKGGVIGRIVAHLGEYEHKINKRTGGPESIFIFFEMDVERIEERWPEMKKRERRWVNFFDFGVNAQQILPCSYANDGSKHPASV